jgi:hypothetical protein
MRAIFSPSVRAISKPFEEVYNRTTGQSNAFCIDNQTLTGDIFHHLYSFLSLLIEGLTEACFSFDVGRSFSRQ